MRKVLNVLQSTVMAFDTVNEDNVYMCVGYPLRQDIEQILKALLLIKRVTRSILKCGGFVWLNAQNAHLLILFPREISNHRDRLVCTFPPWRNENSITCGFPRSNYKLPRHAHCGSTGFRHNYNL